MLCAMGAIDEILATIRRLPLQERLRLIERAANEAAADTPKPAAVVRAIAEGASDGKHASTASLLGLMGDDPDLVDQVCSIAYEARRTAHLRAVDE